MGDVGIDLYRGLYICRRTEEYLVKHYPEDEMRTPMHMSMGQEAVPVGICHELHPGDQIFASYRSHAPYLAKTRDIEGFFAEFYGKISGIAQGKSGSLHLAHPEQGHMCSSGIVAAPIPLALGAAYANKRANNGNIACVFFGDGATDEGVFWESINFACLKKLPVVFVCEDNGFAVHTATKLRQGFHSLADVMRQYRIHVVDDSTNDVEGIADLVRTTFEHVRESNSPAFMRFECYRYLEHVGIGDDMDLGFRSSSDLDQWQARDSVVCQRRRLVEQGLEQQVISLETEIDARIENSIAAAKAAPYPGPEQLERGVFHEAN